MHRRKGPHRLEAWRSGCRRPLLDSPERFARPFLDVKACSSGPAQTPAEETLKVVGLEEAGDWGAGRSRTRWAGAQSCTFGGGWGLGARGPDGPVLPLRVAPSAQPGKEACGGCRAQLNQRTTSPRFQLFIYFLKKRTWSHLLHRESKP